MEEFSIVIYLLDGLSTAFAGSIYVCLCWATYIGPLRENILQRPAEFSKSHHKDLFQYYTHTHTDTSRARAMFLCDRP